MKFFDNMKRKIVLWGLLVVYAFSACQSATLNTALYSRYICRSRTEGFIAMVPGSCSQYYECKDGTAQVVACPHFFDPLNKMCVDNNPGCVETYKRISDCEGPCCDIADGGYAVDPNNQAIYYLCKNNEIAEKKQCENGEMFDLVELRCDSASNCPQSTTPKIPCEETTTTCTTTQKPCTTTTTCTTTTCEPTTTTYTSTTTTGTTTTVTAAITTPTTPTPMTDSTTTYTTTTWTTTTCTTTTCTTTTCTTTTSSTTPVTTTTLSTTTVTTTTSPTTTYTAAITTPTTPTTTPTTTPATTTTCTTTTCTTTTCTTTTCTTTTSSTTPVTTTTSSTTPVTTTTLSTPTVTTTTSPTTTYTAAITTPTTPTTTPVTTTTCTTTPCTTTTKAPCEETTTTTTKAPCTTTETPCVTTQEPHKSLVNERPASGKKPSIKDLLKKPTQYVLPSGMSKQEIADYILYGCVDKPNGFLLASLTKCNDYFICRNNIALPVTCGQKYFNIQKNICDWPTNTGCIQSI